MLQHELGVVAAPFLLDHRGGAGRGQPRKQYRRLDLRRGDRRAIDDRDRIARTFQDQRQAPAFRTVAAARAHLLQRIEDPPHRPRAEAGVAVERRRNGRARDRPHGQPASGSGIAEIQWFFRCREARDADAVHRPRPFALALDLCPQGPHRVCGIEDVLALQKPRNLRLAHRERAQDEGAVRDRLVAGDPDTPGQGRALAGLKGLFCSGMGHRRQISVGDQPPSRPPTPRHEQISAHPNALLTAAIQLAK